MNIDFRGDKLKPIDRQLKVLDEHIQNADTYMKYRETSRQYKAQKPKKQEAFFETHRMEMTLFQSAERYLKGVLNGRDTIPNKAWQEEHAQKTAEKQQLYLEYKTLKTEVNAAEKIRSAIYSIMAQERHREQPNRGRDMER